MSIGEELRHARRARGVTIEQLSSATKISASILRALEADDLARLPGWVFTRGFLRAYAHEVGLDPEQTIARFVAQITPPDGSSDANADASDGRGSRTFDESATDAIDVSEHSTDLGQMIAVAVIVVAAIGYLGLHNRTTPVSASTSARTLTSTPSMPAEVPVGTAGVMPAPAPAAADTANELKIDLKATGPCWVQVTADDQPRLQRLLNPGEHEAIVAHEAVTLRVGDPAAFSFSVNGAPGRSLGEAGRAVTLRMTPQNYREYVAR